MHSPHGSTLPQRWQHAREYSPALTKWHTHLPQYRQLAMVRYVIVITISAIDSYWQGIDSEITPTCLFQWPPSQSALQAVPTVSLSA